MSGKKLKKVKAVQATFQGEDGSLGYTYGRTHNLQIEGNTISRLDGTGVCKYTSIETFFDNWTNVQKLQ